MKYFYWVVLGIAMLFGYFIVGAILTGLAYRYERKHKKPLFELKVTENYSTKIDAEYMTLGLVFWPVFLLWSLFYGPIMFIIWLVHKIGEGETPFKFWQRKISEI